MKGCGWAWGSQVSDRAHVRGGPQLGSLGGGNHFLEVQVVDQVRDARAAAAMRLEVGQVCVMLHTGSRGIGHQTCTDHLKVIDRLAPALGIRVPDRQLSCAPLERPEAVAYLGAMRAAGNFALANRHVLADGVRRVFAEVLGRPAADLGMELVYDVSHNLAKLEEHEAGGRRRTLCVHRKGATRALGPGHPELPDRYRDIGQPVINPGSMGSPSYVLVGDARAETRSFASTCHGAGRAMSRTKAKKLMSGADLRRQLEAEGVVLAVRNWKLLSEEAPYAYKDATAVVEACEGAGLSRVVARLRPVGVLKG
jgi:tRNA-splicing ligase RtcB